MLWKISWGRPSNIPVDILVVTVLMLIKMQPNYDRIAQITQNSHLQTIFSYEFGIRSHVLLSSFPWIHFSLKLRSTLKITLRWKTCDDHRHRCRFRDVAIQWTLRLTHFFGFPNKISLFWNYDLSIPRVETTIVLFAWVLRSN